MSFKTIIDNATGVVTQDGGQVTLPAPTEQGQTLVANSSGAYVASTVNPTFKNRIINGDMRVAQRGTAALTVPTQGIYPVDRFYTWKSTPWTGLVVTTQQSNDAPAGFSNSLITTVVTGNSSATGYSYYIIQPIEGTNMSDFGWGTASAKNVTVSFWVKSSLAGTYSVSLRKSSINRSFVADYSINQANTWERKIISIPGDTSGAWTTDASLGVDLNFPLRIPDYTTSTLNSWQSSQAMMSTTANALNFSGTSGRTFQITGVQLELGSVATPFEMRPMQIELALCQRYYQHYPSQTNPYACFGTGVATSTGAAKVFFKYATAMRATPTLSFSLPVSNFMFSDAGFFRQFTGFGASYYGDNTILFDITASSLTQGRAMTMFGNNTTNAFLALSAEL